MATAQLTVSPASPKHGQTVTATYTVTGNDGTPPQTAQVTGKAAIGDQLLDVTVSLTLPGTEPLPETFEVPIYDGLVFHETANPRVFTALVP